MPLPMFSWQSSKPLLSHNFVVFVGATPIPFSKVSSMEIAVETEALIEGGENQYVHSLSKPIAAEKILVMERGAGGVGTGVGGAVLTTTANSALRVGSAHNHILICVLDPGGLPKKIYAVTQAILKKRRFSDLNAMSGEVFIESLEFVYRTLTEVPAANMMFAPIKAGRSLISSAPPVPEKFTPPLDSPPPKPTPERFTPPLE